MDRPLDQWARWVLNASFGGDAEQYRSWLAQLTPIRDRVLSNARIQTGDVVLDVGTGHGLIGFSALPLVGEGGRVIFSDVSRELISRCEEISTEIGAQLQSEFLCVSAEALRGVQDESIDVITTRSVLIYVQPKQAAFNEFFRVLRPGGRISIYEPINNYFDDDPNRFWNYDVSPIAELARKVGSAYDSQEAAEGDDKTDPMMDFTERDLLNVARRSGFDDLHLDLQVYVERGAWATSWDALLTMAGNPLEPTLAEAIASTLTAEEAKAFEEYLRPLADAQDGIKEMAAAYLWGSKT
jgi:SAM-dependent methyltransferase